MLFSFKNLSLVILLSSMLGCATTQEPVYYTTDSNTYVLIAATDLHLQPLSVEEMRGLFKGFVRTLRDQDGTFTPFVLDSCKESKRCVADIFRTTPLSLSQRDARRLFTGKGHPTRSEGDMVSLVWRLKTFEGAVGIVPLSLWEEIIKDGAPLRYEVVSSYTLSEIIR